MINLYRNQRPNSLFNHVSPPFFVSGVPTTLFLSSSRVPHFPFPILSLCSPPLPHPICAVICPSISPSSSSPHQIEATPVPLRFGLVLYPSCCSKARSIFFSRLKGDKSARNSEYRALNPGGKTFAHLPCRKASSLRVKVGSFSQIRFEIPEQVDDRGVHKVRFMSLLLLRPSLVPSKLRVFHLILVIGVARPGIPSPVPDLSSRLTFLALPHPSRAA